MSTPPGETTPPTGATPPRSASPPGDLAPPGSDAAADGAILRYAGLWPRLAAYVIDLLIMGIISFPFRVALVQSRSDAGAVVATLLVVLVVHAAYLIGFWSSRGQTPGMRVLRLRIRREDGRTVDARTATLRFLPFGLALIVALLAWAIWLTMAITVATDRRHQGLQDRLAHTVVLAE